MCVDKRSKKRHNNFYRRIQPRMALITARRKSKSARTGRRRKEDTAGRQTAHEVRTQNSDIYYSFVGQITWPKWIDPNGLTQMDLPYDRPMGP